MSAPEPPVDRLVPPSSVLQAPSTPDWDPLSTHAIQDPIAVHRELRTTCPVAWSEQFGGFWTLTKYADIDAAARAPSVFSSRFGATVPKIPVTLRKLPLEADPPEHGDIRGALQPYFARSRLARMENGIRALFGGLLDDHLASSDDDFASGVALAYPVRVLCSFLGLPEQDWNDIISWSNSITRRSTLDPVVVQESVDSLMGYIRGLIKDRRHTPRSTSDDVMSGLLATTIDDRPVSDDEATGAFFLLLGAGHETVTSALGNAVHYLAQHPDEQALLRSEPSRIPNAVEELLRYETPAQLLARVATSDTDVGDRTIRAGDRVALLWTSANHDAEKFPDPDHCVLDRSPNPHLAFGSGIHRCLGRDLARIELRVALEELLERTKNFSLADAKVTRSIWPVMGVTSLRLEIHVR